MTAPNEAKCSCARALFTEGHRGETEGERKRMAKVAKLFWRLGRRNGASVPKATRKAREGRKARCGVSRTRGQTSFHSAPGCMLCPDRNSRTSKAQLRGGLGGQAGAAWAVSLLWRLGRRNEATVPKATRKSFEGRQARRGVSRTRGQTNFHPAPGCMLCPDRNSRTSKAQLRGGLSGQAGAACVLPLSTRLAPLRVRRPRLQGVGGSPADAGASGGARGVANIGLATMARGRSAGRVAWWSCYLRTMM